MHLHPLKFEVVALRALSIASSFGQNGVKTRENSKKTFPTDSSNGQICQGNEQLLPRLREQLFTPHGIK